MIDINYREMNSVCRKFIDKNKHHKKIYLKTKDEHTLSLDVTGRNWYIDVNSGDFPSGEVYIAPLESSAHDTFVADLVYWNGNHYKDVKLTFVQGVLVDTKPSIIFEDLSALQVEARTIAEFGIGFNPAKVKPTGYSLFDEKLSGTCHIAVGMNDQFGGKNQSSVHIDFVSTTTRVKFG